MLRRAALDDLSTCAHLLGEAFADYPWTAWCVDAEDHVQRLIDLQRLTLETVGLPHGHVWVVEEHREIRGVAVWSDSRVDIPRRRLIELADRSRPLHGNRLTAAIIAQGGGPRRPDGDHLFLETMGVDPRHRCRGLGTAVLGPGLDLADERAVVCGLETSTTGNVEFYRGAGFEIVDHRVVPGGGPDVWAMVRHPR